MDALAIGEDAARHRCVRQSLLQLNARDHGIAPFAGPFALQSHLFGGGWGGLPQFDHVELRLDVHANGKRLRVCWSGFEAVPDASIRGSMLVTYCRQLGSVSTAPR